MKIAWGTADASARRVLWVALALLVLACLSILSGMYDDAQARLADQGNYCWRIGRRLNQNGDVAVATWSEDGVRWEVE